MYTSVLRTALRAVEHGAGKEHGTIYVSIPQAVREKIARRHRCRGKHTRSRTFTQIVVRCNTFSMSRMMEIEICEKFCFLHMFWHSNQSSEAQIYSLTCSNGCMKSFDAKSPWVDRHQLERSSLQDLAKCELPNIFSALWKERETYYLLSSLMNWVHFSTLSRAHFLLSQGPIFRKLIGCTTNLF